MTRRRPSQPRSTRQRRSAGSLERQRAVTAAITPLGFASFRLVPIGPPSDLAAAYLPMRLLETRGAVSVFMRPRPR